MAILSYFLYIVGMQELLILPGFTAIINYNSHGSLSASILLPMGAAGLAVILAALRHRKFGWLYCLGCALFWLYLLALADLTLFPIPLPNGWESRQLAAHILARANLVPFRFDGIGLRKVPNTGVSSTLLGWNPNGIGLFVSNQGADGSELQTVDVESGAANDHFMIDNRRGDTGLISPDGSRVVYQEKVFGKPQFGTYIANLDCSQQRLLGILDEAALASPAWSPDGHWLMTTAFGWILDGNEVTNYLVQPDTCEVIPLTWIEDSVLAWSRE